MFGGTAPFVATALIGSTGSNLAPSFYVIAIALVSVVVATAYPERAVSRGSAAATADPRGAPVTT